MGWQLYMVMNPDGGGSKGHFCSPETYDAISADLRARGKEGYTVHLDQPAEYAFVDCGGMCQSNRSYWETQLTGGLTINLPATDFETFYEQLQEAPLEDTPLPHYCLIGWLHVIVLTPAQRDELLAAMQRDWDDGAVRMIARAEQERLEKALEHLEGVGVLRRPKPPEGPIDGGDWN